MKDHRIAQITNELKDAAIEFGHTQQLRAHISRIFIDAIKEQDRDSRHACAENALRSENADHAHDLCMNTCEGLSKKTFEGD